MMIFGDQLNDHQKATLKNVEILGKTRQEHPALRYGTRTERWLNDKFLVYSSQYQNDVVLVAFNKNDYEFATSVYVASAGLQGTLENIFTGQKLSVENGYINISVPANSAFIYVPSRM